MRITYKPVGGSVIVLCGEDLPGAHHSDLRISQRQVQELVPPWAAAAQSPLGRGNWSLDVSFAVARPFSDAEAAEEFARRHRATLADAGILKLAADEGDSDPDYLEAVLVSVDTAVTGADVQITYAFTGGAFTTTDPEASS